MKVMFFVAFIAVWSRVAFCSPYWPNLWYLADGSYVLARNANEVGHNLSVTLIDSSVVMIPKARLSQHSLRFLRQAESFHRENMRYTQGLSGDSWEIRQFSRVNTAFEDVFNRLLRVHIGYRLIGIHELGPFWTFQDEFIKLSIDPMWQRIRMGLRDSGKRQEAEKKIDEVLSSVQHRVRAHEKALAISRYQHQQQQEADEAARQQGRLDALERKQAEQDETLEELEERARKAEEEAEAARRDIERLRRQRGY